jgi:Protein of unknown function (DUF2442)
MYSDFPVVTSATPLQNFHLDLSFSSGERKIFNMQPYLEKGLFRELKKPENFNNLFVANDTVNWLNGDLDISPSTLYLKSASLS